MFAILFWNQRPKSHPDVQNDSSYHSRHLFFHDPIICGCTRHTLFMHIQYLGCNPAGRVHQLGVPAASLAASLAASPRLPRSTTFLFILCFGCFLRGSMSSRRCRLLNLSLRSVDTPLVFRKLPLTSSDRRTCVGSGTYFTFPSLAGIRLRRSSRAIWFRLLLRSFSSKSRSTSSFTFLMLCMAAFNLLAATFSSSSRKRCLCLRFRLISARVFLSPCLLLAVGCSVSSSSASVSKLSSDSGSTASSSKSCLSISSFFTNATGRTGLSSFWYSFTMISDTACPNAS
mmetsp:Transcript_926/g.5814  ORF Transcript_926/g.5814 Transcript_926/m.5814 type:complete len:286 (+) Transcript_926:2902-3759(+)